MGVLLTLLVAGLVGWLADMIVPGEIPWGWLGAIIAGLVGTWIGTALFGDFGPSLAGIAIIPAIIGAIILAVVIALLSRAFAGRTV
ncbi:MAG: GlsB/YeaQ/YmgE family stress response membrane protein [Chloroflexi bacterium]|nr:GlsB/YeaQ/YmgE family stress response membrane protein [Chloroflexota bacterium]